MANSSGDFEKIDFRKEYDGHNCSIDFNAEKFHDHNNLKNAESIDEFLAFYRDNSDLEIPIPFPGKDIIPSEMKATKKLCQDCKHSSAKVPPLSSRTYHLPDRTVSNVCPLEKDFIKGTVFKLKTVPYQKLICLNPDCFRYGNMVPVTPDDYATPEFHDILYMGSPSIVEVTRAKYKCPYCNKRMLCQPISGVEIAPKYHLTARLLREIYNHCISSPGGISLPAEKAIAEGYGINRRQLSSYLKEERKDLVDSYFRTLAEKYRKQHQKSKYFPISGCFCYSNFSLDTSRSLTLYFQSPNETRSSKTTPTDLTLQSAYDYEYVQTAEKWLRGDFSSGRFDLGESHLTVFSHYFSATKHLELAHSYFFFIVRLILLYGQMLQDASDLYCFMLTREVVEALKTDKFFQPRCALSLTKDIYLFSHYIGQDKLATGAKDLIDYIESNFSRRFNDPVDNDQFYNRRTLIQSTSRIDELTALLAADFSSLSEDYDEGHWEDYYQNNIDLVIQRLLFFNEASIASAIGLFPSDMLYDEDGHICGDIDFSSGISVDLLIDLVREKGLFSTEL